MEIAIGIIGVGLCLALAACIGFAMAKMLLDQCWDDDPNAAGMSAEEWAEINGEDKDW